MKKACSLLAIAALVTGLHASASAGTPYASGNIGISWFSDLDATETDLDDRDDYFWDVSMDSGVGGAFYNFDDVGIADEDNEIGTTNGSTWAYQLGAGLSYPVGENARIEGRYRYFKTAEFTTNEDFAGFDDEAYNLDIESHSILIGLRYSL